MSTLHEQVRTEIVRRVASGAYAPSQQLPSTEDLAREFEVSMLTVKRALRDLRGAGVLSAVPRLGTFVKEKRRFIRDLDRSFNSLENARDQGRDAAIDLISIGWERIGDPAMRHFDAPDVAMVCVRKVIHVDGVPVMYDTAYVANATVDEELRGQFGVKLVVEALIDHGLRFDRSRLLIDAAPASAEAQAAFSIPNGYPTLRRLYAMSGQEHDCRIYGIAEAPFDRLACSLELRVDGPPNSLVSGLPPHAAETSAGLSQPRQSSRKRKRE